MNLLVTAAKEIKLGKDNAELAHLLYVVMFRKIEGEPRNCSRLFEIQQAIGAIVSKGNKVELSASLPGSANTHARAVATGKLQPCFVDTGIQAMTIKIVKACGGASVNFR